MDLSVFFDALEELANLLFPGQLGRLDALIEIVLENLGDIKPTPSQKTSSQKNYMSNTANSTIAKDKSASNSSEP